MTALQALRERDSKALMDAFEDVAQANEFKREILPNQSPADCRWFWQQVMTPDQLEMTINAVRDVCLSVAREFKLESGVHYSLGSLEELPTLICNSQVSELFYARLSKERHSVLRFYLQVIEA